MLTKESKKKWVNALRSGKYEQGKFKLKTKDGKYCCLGVLAELEGKSTSGSFTSKKLLSILQQMNLAELNDKGVPFEVIAGLIDQNLPSK